VNKMIYSRGFRKLISIAVIIAFVFYGDLFVYSQSGGDIVNQFQTAKEEYNKGQYVNAKNRIERIIGTIKGQDQDKKDMFGVCYLILGAIYEKEGTTSLAEENYHKATEYGVESIAGVDLNGLPMYRIVVKRDEYNNGQYDNSKASLEQVIGTIKERNLDAKKILGKCYLLLGAIYEKNKKQLLAEENYNRAKDEYGVESIDGVDLNSLLLYRIFVKGEIDTLFRKAIEQYNTGKNDSSKETIEQVIGIISRNNLDKKEVLGKCYLLLGAIYEKEEETLLAEGYYRKAMEYSVKSIEGADLDRLPIYERIVKGIIVKVVEKRKKKFPVLLVIGGVAVVALAVMLLTKKSGKGCTIAITSPLNNETVTGTVTIQAAITGNCVVDRVEFYIDSTLKGTDTSEPYSYDWDTTTAFVGPHTIRAVAYSSTGNNNDSQITVTVAR